jgi:hypothetical protein
MASDIPSLSKKERLLHFLHRLGEARPPANHDEAMALLASTLNDVENEFSGVPYDLEEQGTDGRMYPPNARFRFLKWERNGVRCYRQVAHATFVADNGAMEIRLRSAGDLGNAIFEKQGKDGRKVSQYDSSE